mgnify:CR=1 FL=1|jgi:hypothetical protein
MIPLRELIITLNKHFNALKLLQNDYQTIIIDLIHK